jgi:hypothetical protein
MAASAQNNIILNLIQQRRSATEHERIRREIERNNDSVRRDIESINGLVGDVGSRVLQENRMLMLTRVVQSNVIMAVEKLREDVNLLLKSDPTLLNSEYEVQTPSIATFTIQYPRTLYFKKRRTWSAEGTLNVKYVRLDQQMNEVGEYVHHADADGFPSWFATLRNNIRAKRSGDFDLSAYESGSFKITHPGLQFIPAKPTIDLTPETANDFNFHHSVFVDESDNRVTGIATMSQTVIAKNEVVLTQGVANPDYSLNVSNGNFSAFATSRDLFYPPAVSTASEVIRNVGFYEGDDPVDGLLKSVVGVSRDRIIINLLSEIGTAALTWAIEFGAPLLIPASILATTGAETALSLIDKHKGNISQAVSAYVGRHLMADAMTSHLNSTFDLYDTEPIHTDVNDKGQITWTFNTNSKATSGREDFKRFGSIWSNLSTFGLGNEPNAFTTVELLKPSLVKSEEVPMTNPSVYQITEEYYGVGITIIAHIGVYECPNYGSVGPAIEQSISIPVVADGLDGSSDLITLSNVPIYTKVGANWNQLFYNDNTGNYELV